MLKAESWGVCLGCTALRMQKESGKQVKFFLGASSAAVVKNAGGVAGAVTPQRRAYNRVLNMTK